MNGAVHVARSGNLQSALKAAIPVALALAAAAWAILAPPILQDQAYHRLADTRVLAGVANAADTLSNLAFLVAGALGLVFLQRERASASSERARSTTRARLDSSWSTDCVLRAMRRPSDEPPCSTNASCGHTEIASAPPTAPPS